MSDAVSIQELAQGLRALSQSNPSDLQVAIESYLGDKLRLARQGEGLVLLERLARQFDMSTESKAGLPLPSEESSRLVSLLLGKQISISDLCSAELSEKLAESLNTVFNTLNEIIGVINTTLLGHRAEQETIRQIIGMHIGGGGGDNSLQNYLDQIRDAFLTAHKAFRQATEGLFREMLTELDPERIEASTDKGLRFGPLRKAELFDSYKDKFRTIKEGFESGRLTEEFLREFEKVCQKLYKTEGRGIS
ncbi:MAG TPA: type VI secretion system-associated FHA domain protein [Syntrophorhabdales bacterium]|nr:type VI secretion system-associated FHA domain protein [Syntrophorhabdales bacterium]